MNKDHDDTFDIPADMQAELSAGRKPGLTAQAVTAALMSADGDVDLPGNARPSSVTSNLLALKVGENYTRSFRIPPESSIEEIEANIVTWRAELRNNVNRSVRLAMKNDDRRFSMESAQTVSPSGAYYLQVIVTRID